MDFIGIPSVICTNKDDVLPLQWPLDLHIHHQTQKYSFASA